MRYIHIGNDSGGIRYYRIRENDGREGNAVYIRQGIGHVYAARDVATLEKMCASIGFRFYPALET